MATGSNLDSEILNNLLDDHTYVAVFDDQFRFVRTSAAYERAFGLPREQIEGAEISSIFGLDVFQNTMVTKLKRCLLGETVQYKQWINYKTAGKRYVRVTYKPFRPSPSTQAYYILSIVDDMTDLKLAESDLRENAFRMKLGNIAAQIGIWEFDYKTDFLRWDARVFEIFGCSFRDFGNSNTKELWERALHPDDRENVEQTFAKATQVLESVDTSFRIIRPTGEIRHVKSNAMILDDEDGHPSHMIGTNIDITDQIHNEERLKLSEETARREIQAKAGLLDLISLEVQNRLKEIEDPIETLERLDLPKEARQAVDKIRRTSKALSDTTVRPADVDYHGSQTPVARSTNQRGSEEPLS